MATATKDSNSSIVLQTSCALWCLIGARANSFQCFRILCFTISQVCQAWTGSRTLHRAENPFGAGRNTNMVPLCRKGCSCDCHRRVSQWLASWMDVTRKLPGCSWASLTSTVTNAPFARVSSASGQTNSPSCLTSQKKTVQSRTLADLTSFEGVIPLCIMCAVDRERMLLHCRRTTSTMITIMSGEFPHLCGRMTSVVISDDRPT